MSNRVLGLATFYVIVCASLTAADLPRVATPIPDPRLTNAHRLTDKVIAGAEPQGAAAMQALKDLGVKTIISVDGSAPDVELAKKFGLRYIHLPIGYDGVPLARSLEIAKALEELDGPVYVHCHHGMHRGPAAAATACVVAGMLNNAEALAAMKVLGTGENYAGLWKSARAAKPAAAHELAQLKVEYHEVTPIPPLAEAMVHVDEAFELLGDCQKAAWKAPAKHPDLDPAHEALKLRELFAEFVRSDELKTRPADFREMLATGFTRAQTLENALRALPVQNVDAAYIALQNNCKACHAKYRNTKPTAP